MVSKPRARAKILSAAESLLASEGLLAVTTNRVAEASGVNISTLYKHFRNKVEILTELLRDFENDRIRHIAEWDGTIDNVDDWQAWVRSTIESMIRFRRGRPAARQLRAAIKVYQELAVVDADSTSAAVSLVISRLPTPSTSKDRASLVALLTLASQTMSMVLDDVNLDSIEVDERVEALAAFITGSFTTIERLTA